MKPLRLLSIIFGVVVVSAVAYFNRNHLGGPPVVADMSLNDDRYAALGVPSLDHVWTQDDMKVAASTLKTLAGSHPEQLPRYQSPKSGRTFSQIVDRRNLQLVDNQSLPVEEHLQVMLGYFTALNDILQLYVPAAQAQKTSCDNLIDIMGIELLTSKTIFKTADDLVATLSKTDPQYAARMAGYAKMRGGFATMADGVITSLTESQSYSIADRDRLLDYCRETFPSIVSRLPPESQTKIVDSIKKLVDDPSLEKLQPKMILLRDEVDAAVKAGPTK